MKYPIRKVIVLNGKALSLYQQVNPQKLRHRNPYTTLVDKAVKIR